MPAEPDRLTPFRTRRSPVTIPVGSWPQVSQSSVLVQLRSRMVDESEVRELIGRMSAVQPQGFHVTPAGIKLVLAALRFYLAASSWLAKPATAPHDDPPRKKPQKYTGPLPTIADSRRLGLLACIITCDGRDCGNEKRITFDELGLPDTTIFVDIPKWRGFKCHKRATVGRQETLIGGSRGCKAGFRAPLSVARPFP